MWEIVNGQKAGFSTIFAQKWVFGARIDDLKKKLPKIVNNGGFCVLGAILASQSAFLDQLLWL